jgi:hypothetical protein
MELKLPTLDALQEASQFLNENKEEIDDSTTKP